MTKPQALYYGILEYRTANRALLDDMFSVNEIADPRDDSDALLEPVEVLFAPLGFMVDGTKMDRCPQLRAIVSNTTGVPHIDLAAAEARGVAVCALHNEQSFLNTITPTAEHTIGLMMAAARRLPAAHEAAVSGQWYRRPWGSPRMLSRMRLGLVGYGRIGQIVGRIAEAIGMDVDYYDPHVAGGCGALMSLARKSDVLSLHAPALPETKGLVSCAVIEALPDGAILVNTARGELLDETALLEALESGRLWAAALDAIEGEYDPDFAASFNAHRLARYAQTHDNLILSPHIGGSTQDAWFETERFVIEKAARAVGITLPACDG
jgi:phosphoglycerate dehydrogenase-like enzyme